MKVYEKKYTHSLWVDVLRLMFYVTYQKQFRYEKAIITTKNVLVLSTNLWHFILIYNTITRYDHLEKQGEEEKKTVYHS